MFIVSKISSLYGLVGLRQPFNPTYAILDSDNQISRSGYYVTDNPYVKIEYLKDSQDFSDISVDDFNLYLKRMQLSSIFNVCNKVFNRFDYLDRSLLYKNANNKINRESLQDGFVGYKINVSQENNIAFEIKRVLLDFDTLGTFKLLLFNTSKSEPIESLEIEITSKTQEVELNWIVDNSNTTYKGDYYIGYIKSATTPIPFKRDYSNSDIMSSISHLNIEKVSVVGHNTETLFNLNNTKGLSEYMGLNFDITVYEDFTDLIIQNERLFARAIQLDMTIAILREYLNSLRINTKSRQSDEMAAKLLIEIEGQEGDGIITVTGLRPQLVGEITELSREVNKLIDGYFNNSIRATTLT